jgi:hypothetical protein
MTRWAGIAEQLLSEEMLTMATRAEGRSRCNEILRQLRSGKRRYNFKLAELRKKLRLWRINCVLIEIPNDMTRILE